MISSWTRRRTVGAWKLLPIVDEYTRECHAILVKRSITAEEVVSLLSYLFSVHGEPEFIRSDNGPEFIANAVRSSLESSGVHTLYVEPGSPWKTRIASRSTAVAR